MPSPSLEHALEESTSFTAAAGDVTRRWASGCDGATVDAGFLRPESRRLLVDLLGAQALHDALSGVMVLLELEG